MINKIGGFIAAFSVANAVEMRQEMEEALIEKKAEKNTASCLTQATCCSSGNSFYVPQLPFFRETEKWPCSYAGTLPSNADGSHQMFFWMYPANDENAPVTVWLNGGPGASSTFANFLFSSPLRIDQLTRD